MLLPAAAQAQSDEPFSSPGLRGQIPGGSAQGTATPTPEATETATPEPTATAEATATARPKRPRELANTGSDPGRVALMGLVLVGFGLSLRLRIALGDARRD